MIGVFLSQVEDVWVSVEAAEAGVFRQLSQYSVVLSRTDSDSRGRALEVASTWVGSSESRFPTGTASGTPGRRRPLALEEFIAGQRLRVKSPTVSVRLDGLRKPNLKTTSANDDDSCRRY